MKILLFITCLFGWSMIYSQTTTLDNCHVRADLDDLPSKIHHDSLAYCNVYWQFDNANMTYTEFPKRFGLESDTGAFMTLYLYKKSDVGYTEIVPYIEGNCTMKPRQKLDDFSNLDNCKLFMKFPFESLLHSFPLKFIFNINEIGMYKLIGYYKTVCENQVTLHKMDEIYFEVI